MIPSDLLSRSLAIGALPDRVVAIPEPLLQALLAGRRADASARTWGELRNAAPGLWHLLWDDRPDPPADDEERTPLADDDAFPHADALMLEWVPNDLQARLGQREHDRTDGEWLQIEYESDADLDHAARVLEAAGYRSNLRAKISVRSRRGPTPSF